MLPLRTDRRPAGAVALYGPERHAFQGAAHDIALTFAAQGGTAMRNAAQYRECRQMLNNLHVALASQATIEQAKGILPRSTVYRPRRRSSCSGSHRTPTGKCGRSLQISSKAG